MSLRPSGEHSAKHRSTSLLREGVKPVQGQNGTNGMYERQDRCDRSEWKSVYL